MKKFRAISKRYYLRQIMVCWLVWYMMFGLPAQIAWATPANPNVVGGNAAVNQNGNTTTVNMGSSNAVINWDSLNTSSSEILQFLKAGGSFAVLNRVIQGGATQFDGSLFGNQGHIIIVNPHGIVFGPTSFVQAQKFTASALDIANTDFMNGVYNFAGGGVGEVANYGKISAQQVALIGKKVLNAGVIQAPEGCVIMAAGDKVYLGNENGDIVVEVTGVAIPDATDASFKDGDVINEGTIEAAGGKIILAAGDTFSRAVEGIEGLSLAVESGIGRVGQFGTINADGVDGDGGSITLTAGEVVVLGKDSITTANAGTNGDGGDIIAYSPDTAIFRDGAVVEAKGGTESGNGGFFELSGLENVEVLGHADLTASNGETGNFLIDPRNIKIVDKGWNPNNGWWDDPIDTWHPLFFTSWLDIDWLELGLSLSNITLHTGYWPSPGLAPGWVWFDAGRDVRNFTSHSLTVKANNHILLDSGIDFAGSGNVTLNARKDIIVNAGIDLASGHLALLAGQNNGSAGLRINDDITAGSMLIKNGKIIGNEATHSWINVADGVKLTSTVGDIGIEAVHDIILGNGEGGVVVDAAGNLYINADRQGQSGHGFGGDVVANADLIAGGNVGMWANAMYLGGDVRANGGNLWITGRTSRDNNPGTGGPSGTGSGINVNWGDIEVAANKTLYASGNMYIKDAQHGGAGQMELVGNSVLTLQAGGAIFAPETLIKVNPASPAYLTMHQGASLDTASYIFGNQGNTHLTLISDNGSVTSTMSKPVNAADEWRSIGATAKENITLSGNGSIALGNSGTDPTRSLWAKNGDIEVTSGYNVTAAKNLWAGDDIDIEASHGISLKSAHAGDHMDLSADSDTRWGHDVIATGHLYAGKTMNLEGTNVRINSAHSGGNMDIYAHGLYNAHNPSGTEWLIGSGDVVINGRLSSGGSIDIAATAFGPGGFAVGPTFWGGSDYYGSDGTIYLKHNNPNPAVSEVDAAVDVRLHNKTIANHGVKIDAGRDVTAYDKLIGKGALTVEADRNIWLLDDVVGARDVGGDLKILADHDKNWNGDVTALGKVQTLIDGGGKGDILVVGKNVTHYDNVKSVRNLTIVAREDLPGNNDNHTGSSVQVLNGASLGSFGAMTVHADDHILLTGMGLPAGSAKSGGDMVLRANADHPLDGSGVGDMTAYGDLTSVHGSIDIYSSDTTTYLYGNATAHHDLRLYNNTKVMAAGKTLSAGDDVEAYGKLHGKYDLNVEAGDDIRLRRNVSSAGNMTINAGDDIELNNWSGNTTAGGEMKITAGKTNPDGDVKAWGKLQTTNPANGNLTVKAADNIDLYNTPTSADAAGKLTLIADSDDNANGNLYAAGNLYGNMLLSGYNVTVNGDVISAGTLDVDADRDIRLKRNVVSDGDMTMTAGDDIILNQNKQWFAGGKTEAKNGKMTLTANTDNDGGVGDLKVYGNLKTTGAGNKKMTLNAEEIKVYGSVDAVGTVEMTAYEGPGENGSNKGNVTVKGNINSKRNVRIFADDHITLGTSGNGKGNVTANRNVRLIANNDGQLTGNVTVYGNIKAKGFGPSNGDITVKGRNIRIKGSATAENNIKMIAYDNAHTNTHGDVEVGGKLKAGNKIDVKATDDISLYHTPTSADAGGTLTLIADSDNTGNGDLFAAGNLYGNMTLSGYDVTVVGNVISAGTLDVDADDDITLMRNVSSQGKMTLDAGDNIRLNGITGNTTSQDEMILNAGLAYGGGPAPDFDFDPMSGSIRIGGHAYSKHDMTMNATGGGIVGFDGMINDIMSGSIYIDKYASSDGKMTLTAVGGGEFATGDSSEFVCMNGSILIGDYARSHRDMTMTAIGGSEGIDLYDSVDFDGMNGSIKIGGNAQTGGKMTMSAKGGSEFLTNDDKDIDLMDGSILIGGNAISRGDMSLTAKGGHDIATIDRIDLDGMNGSILIGGNAESIEGSMTMNAKGGNEILSCDKWDVDGMNGSILIGGDATSKYDMELTAKGGNEFMTYDKFDIDGLNGSILIGGSAESRKGAMTMNAKGGNEVLTIDKFDIDGMNGSIFIGDNVTSKYDMELTARGGREVLTIDKFDIDIMNGSIKIGGNAESRQGAVTMKAKGGNEILTLDKFDIDVMNGSIKIDGYVKSKNELTLRATGSSGGFDVHDFDILNGDVTVLGNVESTDSTVSVYASDDIRLKSDVSSADNMTMKAGDDIELNKWAGNTTAGGEMKIIAGKTNPSGDVKAWGKLMTTNPANGNLTVKAADNIDLYHTPTSADAAGKLKLIADSDSVGGGNLYAAGNLYGNMLLSGYNVIVNGDVISAGTLDVDADKDIRLKRDVVSDGDMTMTAGDDIILNQNKHWNVGGKTKAKNGKMTLTANTDNDGGVGKLKVYGNLKTTGAGNKKMTLNAEEIKVYGSVNAVGIVEMTAYEGPGENGSNKGNVTVKGNINSERNVRIFADDHITLGTSGNGKGNVTADRNVRLIANNDGQLTGNVKVYGNIKAKGFGPSNGDITVKGRNIDIKGGATAENNIKLIAYDNAHTNTHGDVEVGGKLKAGNKIDVKATDDISLYHTPTSADAGGTLTLIADSDNTGNGDLYAAGNLFGNMLLSGYNVTVDGKVESDATLTVLADVDITLKKKVSSVDDMKMRAGQSITLNENGGKTTSGANIKLLANRDPSAAVAKITTGTIKAVGNVIAEGEQIEVNGNIKANSVKLTTIDDFLAGGIASDIDVSGNIKAVDKIVIKSHDSVKVGGSVTSDESFIKILANTDNLTAGGIEIGGRIKTFDTDKGNITLKVLPNAAYPVGTATGDIKLHGNVISAKRLTIEAQQGDILADKKLQSRTNMYLSSIDGSIIVEGKVLAGRNLEGIAGTDIILKKQVKAGKDIDLQADRNIALNENGGNTKSLHGDIDIDAGEDVYGHGDIIAKKGSVEISSSDFTTYLGGDVTAFIDVLLNNNTEFTSTDDQHVTAQTGSITASGYLEKPEDGSLYLLANENISLADHVAVENGGISIIAETGKIFTPGGADDTLNVDISGMSDHKAGIGVDLPKDYDAPPPAAAGVYETGKAAIVIMSEKALKLGPDGTLTAEGTYYADGSVDDRPGVDFANYNRPGKPGGDPIDIAIYLASNSRQSLGGIDYEGDVHVGSPVADLPDGAVMVADAYDTVTFGDAFEDSLENGNVDWLEVCSRISDTYEFAWTNNKLPKSKAAWDLAKYVWRGEGGGDDGGAWVLEPALGVAPLGEAAAITAQEQAIGSDGCPALMAAAAAELGVAEETIEVYFANSFAFSTDVQPCETCARLIDAATILSDEDGSRMAAMLATFNALAPTDAPFTPEMATSIATAFEGAAEGSQYATAMEYIDAFVQYVAVLDGEMGSPVGDSVIFVMGKHGTGITGSGNANIAAYIQMRLAQLGG